jgi:LmbE family N-acetylglucosaminyl deacetylase
MNQELADWLRRDRPLSLQSLHIPPSLRLVVLAPHPDDFDAVAVTMRFFWENGNRVDVAVVTSGASGVEDGFGGALTPAAKAKLRECEQRESWRSFGLPDSRLTFLRSAEDNRGHPEESAANRDLVSSYITLRRPDLVFLPHGHDPNPGHRRTYEFLLWSVRKERLALLACLNQDPKTISMRKDLYLPFGAELAMWKGALLRMHRSQQQRNLNTRGYGFDERILQVNRRSAAELGLREDYAEAFEMQWLDETGDGGMRRLRDPRG